MPENSYVEIEYDDVVAVTKKAVLLKIDEEEIWIPFSQLEQPQNFSKGEGEGSISMTEWIAKQKGLEG